MKDGTLKDGVACDEIGCVARLADGALVALPFAAEAFEEDCRRASLVVSPRTAPPSCAATAIDRGMWQRTGASALYRVGNSWVTEVAFPRGYDRPWAHRAERSAGTTPSTPARPAPQIDATPAAEDLSADD